MFHFFYDVYLDTERDMNDELKDRKKGLINEITSDMINISENLGDNNINIKNFKGLTNYQGNKGVLDHGVQMSLIKGEVK